MKTGLWTVGCATVLLATTAAPAQSSLPPGSYKDSCTNEVVTGNTLKAKCKTMAGTMLDASLTLPCAGLIDNINGKLVCKPGPPGPPKPPAPGAALPAGSYQQTCSGAKVAGNTLTAKCKTMAGGLVDTSLPLPCSGSIENANGKLTCKAAVAPPKPPVAALPKGSYNETCTGETVANNVLRAKCKNRAGTLVDTSLNLPCATSIDHIDGKLTCKGAGMLPRPPGK